MFKLVDLVKLELVSVRSFILKPTDRGASKVSNREKFNRVLALVTIELPIMFVIILITSSLDEIVDLDMGDHKLEELLKQSPITFVLSGVLLAPILEEFFFRFFLTFRYAFYFRWPMILIQDFLNVTKNQRLIATRRSWSKIFPYVLYFSVVAFGFVHITNFENASSYLWAIPLLTMPQLVIGVFLGYTRIRYGFLWSVLFHALHNGILLAPVVIFGI